jgi:hypothetical protein
MDLSVGLSGWSKPLPRDKTSDASFCSPFSGSLFGSKTNLLLVIDRIFVKFSRESEKSKRFLKEKQGGNTTGVGGGRRGLKSIAVNHVRSYCSRNNFAEPELVDSASGYLLRF